MRWIIGLLILAAIGTAEAQPRRPGQPVAHETEIAKQELQICQQARASAEQQLATMRAVAKEYGQKLSEATRRAESCEREKAAQKK